MLQLFSDAVHHEKKKDMGCNMNMDNGEWPYIKNINVFISIFSYIELKKTRKERREKIPK